MIEIRSKINNKLLHIINRMEKNPIGRQDIAPPEQILQLCSLRFSKGKTFRSHCHIWKDSPADSVIAQESWVVIKGAVEVTLYDTDGELIDRYILNEGDVSITFEGGHAYKILNDDTVVYEYKTGPYEGQKKDKVFLDNLVNKL